MSGTQTVIGFDLGGTLLEYEGLPLSWVDYYEQAFNQVGYSLGLNLDGTKIDAAISTLRKYNPRINPREIEYSSDYIFSEATSRWDLGNRSVSEIAVSFYSFFQKRVKIFPDTQKVLPLLHDKELTFGILTDLPTGMPDASIRQDILLLGSKIDCLLTSAAVGFRKPNTKGYLLLAKALKTEPARCIFVGDEEKDMIGANRAGMISVLIDRNQIHKEYGQKHTIKSLSELLDLV